MTTASKTFRASTLTEALAQVREELGPDAVVVRRREGLEGGLAGFFQRAVVEVDAQRGGPSVDVRDDEAPVLPELEPAPALLELEPAPALVREAAAAGFAAALATAAGERTPAAKPHADPAVDAIPMSRDNAPEVVPVRTAARVSVAPTHPEADRVLETLRRAGVSEAFAQEVVEEAAIHGMPFADAQPTARLRPLVARAIARRLDAAPLHGARVAAVVGPAGAGKTAIVARLAIAYASAGRLPVAVIALCPKDGGAELARLLAPAGVPLQATDDVEGAAARITNLRGGALVLVDTPAIPARDVAARDALADQLRRLGLDEVHLALPAVLAGEVARDLVDAARELGAARVALTHADETARLGMAVELAAQARLPVSYLLDSGAVRPAAAEDLAFALLP